MLSLVKKVMESGLKLLWYSFKYFLKCNLTSLRKTKFITTARQGSTPKHEWGLLISFKYDIILNAEYSTKKIANIFMNMLRTKY
jgi:hypothetical protein